MTFWNRCTPILEWDSEIPDFGPKIQSTTQKSMLSVQNTESRFGASRMPPNVHLDTVNMFP